MATHNVIIEADYSWTVMVHGQTVDPKKCAILAAFPQHLGHQTLQELVKVVDSANVCCSNPDSHFVSLLEDKKGKIVSTKGSISAHLDAFAAVSMNGEVFTKTVRTTSCEILSKEQKCQCCILYRDSLRAISSKRKKKHPFQADDSLSKHTNERYLTTPEKKFKKTALREKANSCEKKLLTLKARVSKFLEVVKK